MAVLDEYFDATTVKPDSGFRLIPAGKYTAMLIASELMNTKANDGMILKLKFQITEGDEAGSEIGSTINWRNKSQKAQEIGRAQFSALCHAVGVLGTQETEDLHFRPLVIDVRVEETESKKDGQIQYDETGKPKMFKNNKIDKFTAIGAAVPQQQAPVARPPQQPQGGHGQYAQANYGGHPQSNPGYQQPHPGMNPGYQQTPPAHVAAAANNGQAPAGRTAPWNMGR